MNNATTHQPDNPQSPPPPSSTDAPTVPTKTFKVLNLYNLRKLNQKAIRKHFNMTVATAMISTFRSDLVFPVISSYMLDDGHIVRARIVYNDRADFVLLDIETEDFNALPTVSIPAGEVE